MTAVRTAIAILILLGSAVASRAEFQAGAAVVDATPPKFPVLVNGGMLSRSADAVKTTINARALVLSDETTTIAVVVVDSCMMPRPLLDDAKALAEMRTGIPAARILISATHTHTAPSCMGCLGTSTDEAYVPWLREKLVEAIVAAHKNLEPAQVGWGSVDAGKYTAVRRWIRRPDRIADDPFGNATVRANMHAGANWDDATGPAGPEDPALSFISVQSRDGRPLAILANFSMHYFGDSPLSADYFGLFSDGLAGKLGRDVEGKPPLVAMMSHGCSGDIWRRDYTQPAGQRGESDTIDGYASALVDLVAGAYDSVEYRRDAELAMAEARLKLNYRVPDRQRLEWAQKIVDAMGDRVPKETPEVYAREQLILHERRSTEVVVQALRIGEIAVATTPTETYALTGLKIKAQSPVEQTMVFDLANGGDGYIPPPEHHHLGGYNTWPARSAGLEVQAEPKITEAAVALLAEVCNKPRRRFQQSRGHAVDDVLATKPAAYWRLDEFAGPRAVDISGHDRDGIYEPGVVFFLEGPQSDRFCRNGETNRAPHFAGGRMRSRVAGAVDRYTVSMWIWNGMPADGRDVAGWFLSRGRSDDHDLAGEHFGVAGKTNGPGKLLYRPGGRDAASVTGNSLLERWTWNHVVVVRDGANVQVFLNGAATPEIESEAVTDVDDDFEWFVGGRCDNDSNWEGRIDEVALFDRVLSDAERARLAATELPARP